jgi:tetratricopeptide (TPR) repeat protein
VRRGRAIEIPSDVRRAFEAADFDDVVSWLEELPADSRWSPAVLDLAETVAEIFLNIDPRVSSRVLDKLVQQQGATVHAHLLRVDAAARRGDAGAALELFAPIRDHLAATNTGPADRIEVLNNVGTFLKAAGAFNESEALFREALSLCDASTVDAWRRVLINLATVLTDRVRGRGGDTGAEEAKALDLLDEAEHLGGEDPAGYGSIWFNRGHIYAISGRGALAAVAYDQAETHFRAAGSRPLDLAYIERARAADAGRNGRAKDSAVHYERAKDYFLESGDFDEAVATSGAWILARHLSGEVVGETELDELLTRTRQTRPSGVGDVLVNIGNILMDRDPAAAAERFRDAEAEYEHFRRPVDVERARHSRAVIIRRQGDPASALEMLTQVRNRYAEWGLTTKVAEADFNIAVAMRDLGLEEATSRAMASYEVLDRNRHALATAADRLGTRTITYRYLLDLNIELALRDGDNDLVAALAERARTQTMLASNRVEGSEQLAAPASVASRTGATVVAGDGETRTLTHIAETVGGPGSVWLTWTRYRDRLLRVVVTPAMTRIDQVPFPTELLTELDDATSLYPAGTAVQDDAGPAARRRAEYRIATGPILDDSQLAAALRASMPRSFAEPWTPQRHDAGAESLFESLAGVLIPDIAWASSAVVIAPPSYLGHVPWAALKKDFVWSERSNLTLVPPVSTMREEALQQSHTVTAWVADTTGDLVYCRRTLDGFDPLVGASATVAAVLARLSAANRVIIRAHIRPGTADMPRTAAIRLADGEMSTEDLDAALNSHVPPEWIILGCDASGTATGDEWSGLPVGLGSAGAQQLIVTQWPIVDCPQQETLDLELIGHVDRLGLEPGFRRWQRACASRWAETGSADLAPHRWAGHALVTLVTGRS